METKSAYFWQKYLNRYFQEIGIENEGLKRITTFAIYLWMLIPAAAIIFLLLGMYNSNDNEIARGISLIIVFILGFSMFSIILKLCSWIWDGFQKGKTPNE